MADVDVAAIEELDEDRVAERLEAIEPTSREDLDGGRR